jgi:hypothetical protein
MFEPSNSSTFPAALAQGAAGAGSARSPWQLSLPLACGAAVYAYTLARGRDVLADGDTLTHVSAGRWMLEHGAIPTQDPFLHPFPAQPWIPTSGWGRSCWPSPTTPVASVH